MWINKCVFVVFASIIVNRLPGPTFNMKRGLCQVCPLSPTLQSGDSCFSDSYLLILGQRMVE